MIRTSQSLILSGRSPSGGGTSGRGGEGVWSSETGFSCIGTGSSSSLDWAELETGMWVLREMTAVERVHEF